MLRSPCNCRLRQPHVHTGRTTPDHQLLPYSPTIQRPFASALPYAVNLTYPIPYPAVCTGHTWLVDGHVHCQLHAGAREQGTQRRRRKKHTGGPAGTTRRQEAPNGQHESFTMTASQLASQKKSAHGMSAAGGRCGSWKHMQPRGAASSMQAPGQARTVARTAPGGLPGRICCAREVTAGRHAVPKGLTYPWQVLTMHSSTACNLTLTPM